jgi:hypothetical protein
VYRATSGFWVAIQGQDFSEKEGIRTRPMGVITPCMERTHTRLFRFGDDLVIQNDIELNDIEIDNISTRSTWPDAAAITLHDSCLPYWQPQSGILFIDAGGAKGRVLASSPGVMHSARVALPLEGREWLLVSQATRQLDAWRSPVSDDVVPKDPELLSRSFSSSDQSGLLLTRVSEGGSVSASSLQVSGGQVLVSDAYLDRDGSIVFVGSNNGALFRGRTLLP